MFSIFYRRHNYLRRLLTAIVAITTVAGCDIGTLEDKAREPLRLNHLQNMGTHNSYHAQPLDERITRVIERHYRWFEREHYLYAHAPLDVQLAEQGVRHLELDIYADPEGGRFNTIPIAVKAGMPVDRDIEALEQPGFKVLHIPQLDPNTTCLTLVECLSNVKQWSDLHPSHQPLLIIIEIKDVDFLGVAPHIKMQRFTAEDFAAVDADILSVFPRERIITPDDVQGDYATLESAVLAGNWPELEKSRGKVFFTQYHGQPRTDTEGMLLFPQVLPGDPAAAIVVVEDIIKDADNVKKWVQLGYLVRTRADRDMQEVINNDYSKLEAALDSGAHFISTDVPTPNQLNPTFTIRIPGGTPARCNPVTAPRWCRAFDIENPDTL